VGEGDELLGLTAEEILCGLEEGRLAADVPVRIQQDAEPRPLGRYVRELVWLAHQRHVDANEQAVDRTLFEAAFERAPIGVVLSDLAGRLLQANDAFCDLLGYTHDEISGLRVGQLSESADRDAEIALGNELLSGKRNSYQIEKRFRTRAGEIVDTYTAISVIRQQDGAPLHVIAHVMDLTPLKHLEKSQQVAEAESRAKTAFLSSMSHEIRTPMNAILGYAQLLQREPGLTAQQREYLETIDRSGEHLLALINAVLDMAKIEAGQDLAILSEVNLHKLLRDLERMFRLPTSKKGVSFTVTRSEEVPAVLRTDAGKLRQILINLIGNAIKFTDQGSINVRVTSKDSRLGKIWLVVEVADTGFGIDPKSLGKVFEAFKQVGASHTKLGTGLGLAVSREFARLLGGQITATSELGAGSVFRLEIEVEPLDSDESIASLRHVVSLVPGRKTPSVMVVDDDIANRVMLENMLQSVGFVSRSYASGQEALKALDQSWPDLLLLDLKMPEMDGVEVLQRVRALEGGDKLPVVIVSASVLESEREATRSAGANAFVSKPIHEEQLFAIIANLLAVEYLYAGEEAPPEGAVESSAVDLASVGSLSVEIIEALHAAASVRDMIAVDELVDRVGAIVPVLAEQMRAFSVTFDYDGLLELLSDQFSTTGAEG
jgi:PAS domain S-box-containing protein